MPPMGTTQDATQQMTGCTGMGEAAMCGVGMCGVAAVRADGPCGLFSSQGRLFELHVFFFKAKGFTGW